MPGGAAQLTPLISLGLGRRPAGAFGPGWGLGCLSRSAKPTQPPLCWVPLALEPPGLYRQGHRVWTEPGTEQPELGPAWSPRRYLAWGRPRGVVGVVGWPEHRLFNAKRVKAGSGLRELPAQWTHTAHRCAHRRKHTQTHGHVLKLTHMHSPARTITHTYTCVFIAVTYIAKNQSTHQWMN